MFSSNSYLFRRTNECLGIHLNITQTEILRKLSRSTTNCKGSITFRPHPTFLTIWHTNCNYFTYILGLSTSSEAINFKKSSWEQVNVCHNSCSIKSPGRSMSHLTSIDLHLSPLFTFTSPWKPTRCPSISVSWITMNIERMTVCHSHVQGASANVTITTSKFGGPCKLFVKPRNLLNLKNFMVWNNFYIAENLL